MRYIQLNPDKTFQREIQSGENIVWDANNFCTVEHLVKDGKDAQFNVVPLVDTPQPEIDQATQIARRGAFVLVNGNWTQQWEVIELYTTQAEKDAAFAADAEAKRIAAVPKSVSPRQIRQAMTRFGIRQAVETAIAAGDQDIKDWYEFATEFERKHPMVDALATGLGVSERQLDDLFTLAGTL